jgi:hypothetical protein
LGTNGREKAGKPIVKLMPRYQRSSRTLPTENYYNGYSCALREHHLEVGQIPEERR